MHATTAVEIIDLLGTGTSCLVWSEASDWTKPMQVRWLELMSEKPHLLVEVDNGIGLQTRIAYEPSTVQYLRDRAAGRPWITRLPFPVHVVVRIEHADLVARRRFVQRYAYHHGHYDGSEREFHGFACVERWDAESFEDFDHVPPGLSVEEAREACRALRGLTKATPKTTRPRGSSTTCSPGAIGRSPTSRTHGRVSAIATRQRAGCSIGLTAMAPAA